MKYSTEYYETEVEAQREGERCQAFMGLGYDYRYKVWYDNRLDKWVLDASWWSSCD